MNRYFSNFKSIVISLVAFATVFSCSKTPTEVSAIYFTNVQKGQLQISEGDAFRVKYMVEPVELQESATVTWKSSNENVVTVNKRGNIAAVSSGKAKVTASVDNATAVVEVTVNPLVVTDFKLQLSAKGYTGVDIPVEVTDIVPAAATPASISWEIENPEIATFAIYNKVLHVRGLKPGVTKLIGMASGVTRSCELSFADYVPVERVELDPSELVLYYDDIASIECVVIPAAASMSEVTWKVDAPEGLFAEVVQNGKLLSLKAAAVDGEATITAMAEEKSASVKVKVMSPPLTALSIGDMRLSSTGDFGKKKSATLTINRTPSNNTSKITFSSSNTKVATVDQNGVVTAVGHGVAQIKASADGITAVSLVRCYQKSQIEWKLEYQTGCDSNNGDRIYSLYTGQAISTAGAVHFRYYDPAATYTDQNGQTKIDYAFYDNLDDIYDEPDLSYTVANSERKILAPVRQGKGLFYIDANEYYDVDKTSYPKISEILTIQPNFGSSEKFGFTFTVNLTFVIESISFYTYSGKLHQTVTKGGTLNKGTAGDLYAVLNPTTTPSFRSIPASYMYHRYMEGSSKRDAFEGYTNTAPSIKEIGVDATKLKTPSGYNYKVEAVYGFNSFHFYVK